MITKECPHCDKVIEGYTEKSVTQMLETHIIAKHKDKVKFKK